MNARSLISKVGIVFDLHRANLTLFGLAFLQNPKRLRGAKMLPPSNLAISSQRRIKLVKDILWVETVTN